MSLLNRGGSDAPGHRPPEGSRLNNLMSFFRRSPEGANSGRSKKGRESVSPGLPINTAETSPPRNPSASPAARTPETGSAEKAKGGPDAQTKVGTADQSGEQKPGKPGETEAEIAATVTLEEAVEAAAGQGDDSSSNQSSQDNTNRGDLNRAWPPEGEWKKQWEQAVGGDKTISHLDNLRSTSDGTVSEHAMALRDGNGNVLAIETGTRYFNSKDKSREPDERRVYTRFADGRVIEQQFSKTRSSDGRSRVLEYTRRESDPNGAGPVISRNLTISDDGAWKYTETGPDGTRTISHQFDSSQQKWTTTETPGSQTKEIGEPSRAPLDHSQTLRELGVEIPSENMIESPLESLANGDPAADVISIEEGGSTPEHPDPESGGTGESGAEESTATPNSITEQDKPNIEQHVNSENTVTDEVDEDSGAGGGADREDTPPGNEGTKGSGNGTNESARTTGEPPVAGTDKGNESSGSAEATPTQQADKPPETPTAAAPGEGGNSGGNADTGKPPGPGSSDSSNSGDKPKAGPEANEAASRLARDYDAALNIPSSPEEAQEQDFKLDRLGPHTDPKNRIETTTLTRTTLNGDGSRTHETIQFKKLPDGGRQAELTRGTQLKGATISERASRKIVTDTSGNPVQVTRLERTITSGGSPAVREVITHNRRINGQSLEHIRMTPQSDGTVRTERATTNYNGAGQPVNSSYSVETGTINAKVNTHENGTSTYRQSTGKEATGSDFPPGTTAILDYDAQGRLISSKVLDADGKPVANPEDHPFVQRHIALDKTIAEAAVAGWGKTPGGAEVGEAVKNVGKTGEDAETGNESEESDHSHSKSEALKQGLQKELQARDRGRGKKESNGRDLRQTDNGNSDSGSDNPKRSSIQQGSVSNGIAGDMITKGMNNTVVMGNQINIGSGGGRERKAGELLRQISFGLIAINVSLGHMKNTETQGAERVTTSATHH